jgi:uncharacterized membrane protein
MKHELRVAFRWSAWLLPGLIAFGSSRAAEVRMTEETRAGAVCYVLDNGRVALTVAPAAGGRVAAYRDRLGGDVELVPADGGLCLDHFQSQVWPGELLAAPYEVVRRDARPDVCTLTLRRAVSGRWNNDEDANLKDLVLEKTYELRADSPALGCRIRLTAPPKASKLFAYWQQHIAFAGGQYDRLSDKTFRPSARGVRVKAGDQWGYTGAEDFLRDPAAGWLALLDTARRTGLVVLSDYNELDVLYASGGNKTFEPMYRITYLPAGESVEYATWIVPVTGLDNVVAATPDFIAGYAMSTDNRGSGTLTLSAVRSVNPPAALSFDVALAGVQQPGAVVRAGALRLPAPGVEPRTNALAFSGAGPDPLVLRLAAQAGAATTVFEEYFNGAYRWGENIQTDMATPVYRGERPRPRLSLRKPEPLRLIPTQGMQVWYAEGLLDDAYGLAAAVKIVNQFRDNSPRDARQIEYVSYSGNWRTRLSGFPYSYEELLSYDLVILGGVKQEALGLIGMEMLGDYLTAGGSLLVLGGPMAYGASRLQGTDLARSWPVDLPAAALALESLEAGVIAPVQPETPFLQDLDWKAAPCVRFVHRVDVKPWGRTVLTAGGRPFLVVGETGPAKARVACLLGAPMGECGAGRTPFWEWEEWPTLLRQLQWWLLREDYRFVPSF